MELGTLIRVWVTAWRKMTGEMTVPATLGGLVLEMP